MVQNRVSGSINLSKPLIGIINMKCQFSLKQLLGHSGVFFVLLWIFGFDASAQSTASDVLLCSLHVGALSCGNAQRAHNSDSVIDAASAVLSIPQGEGGSELSAAEDEDLSQPFEVKYEGTIGSEKVSMAIIDTDNCLDESGSMWEKKGSLTYKETGRSFKLKGYNGKLNLFLDAFDGDGKKIGHFEFVEDNELDGTYET